MSSVDEDYYKFQFRIPDWSEGYRVAVKNYLDEINVAAQYPRAQEIETFATPGEYEPVAFVIYAAKDLKNVQVRVSELTSERAKVDEENLTLRTVVRSPRRFTYLSPAQDSRVVSRFLFPFKPFHLRAGHFREIWLTIKVPDNTRHGIYSGSVTVKPDQLRSTTIPLTLEVFPFKLAQTFKKRYGVYHNITPEPANLEKVKRELADIRGHGGTLIYPSLQVQYVIQKSCEISISYDKIRTGLKLVSEAEFKGPVPISTGLNMLQKLLKLKNEELETNELFLLTAQKAIEGIKQVQQDFPKLEIALTHLDEVFSRGRLPRYIAFTKAAKRVPGFRFYITFHTVNENAEELRRQLDPYMNIRGNHGYSFEWWLARGHTFEEYERELQTSGDEAWFYLNPNRIWRDAKFQRLVNGLYMWLSPFSGRLDWGYSKPEGDPFDDLDGRTTDTGYAFWSPIHADVLVSTPEWEAWREGIDDAKYLLMVQTLMEKHEGTEAAKAAARWLDVLRKSIPKPQGLEYDSGPTVKRSGSESPFILALRRRFSSDDLQQIRYEAAQHIAKLLQSESKC